MLDYDWLRSITALPRLPFSKKRRGNARTLRHNTHIKHAPSKRIGSKRFWRSLGDHPAFRGQSRRCSGRARDVTFRY